MHMHAALHPGDSHYTYVLALQAAPCNAVDAPANGSAVAQCTAEHSGATADRVAELSVATADRVADLALVYNDQATVPAPVRQNDVLLSTDHAYGHGAAHGRSEACKQTFAVGDIAAPSPAVLQSLAHQDDPFFSTGSLPLISPPESPSQEVAGHITRDIDSEQATTAPMHVTQSLSPTTEPYLPQDMHKSDNCAVGYVAAGMSAATPGAAAAVADASLHSQPSAGDGEARDDDVDCEALESFRRDLPGIRVPLVFDPRWPHEQGGRLVFCGSVPAAKLASQPPAQHATAAHLPTGHHACMHAEAKDVVWYLHACGNPDHAQPQADSSSTAFHGSPRASTRMHGDAEGAIVRLTHSQEPSHATETQCMPLMHHKESAGVGVKYAAPLEATVSVEKIPGCFTGCTVHTCHACMQGRMAERGVCVLGECGEVVQAAYDALHALEEAHGEDDRMLDFGLFPFHELTHVRISMFFTEK